MCIFILVFQVHPEWPLVVASNRDEFAARRSSGPTLLRAAPRIVGGRDLDAGGTWMGVSERGLFAGVANRRTMAPPRPAHGSRRSRGEIVMRALELGSVPAVEAWLEAEDARAYNPFHLVFGDAGELRVAEAREGDPHARVSARAPGVHLVTNTPIGSTTPKTDRAAKLLAPLTTTPVARLVPALEAILGDHASPPPDAVPPPPPWLEPEIARLLQSLCVHTPGYGTRSASVVALEPYRVACYRFADGPPCVTPFVDLTSMLTS